MGEYFMIVNPTKRQYLHACDMRENCKASGYLFGSHARAVAILVCNPNQVRRHVYGELAGSWFGDAIYAAGDDNGPPDQFGIQTSTPEDPTRNLYLMAMTEYENLSHRALAMLCSADESYADDFAERSAGSHLELQTAGDVIFTAGCEALERALLRHVGKDWVKKYKAIQRH